MLELVRRHRITCFLAVTYGFTWGAWWPLAHAQRVVTPGFAPRYVLGLFGPLVGAIVTTAIVYGRAGLRSLAARLVRVRIGLRWWSVALGAPLAAFVGTYVALAAYAMFLLAPLALPSWTSLGRCDGFPVTNAGALWLLLVICQGFAQETGWRGFLQVELQQHHSPFVASLLVAACWAPWHIPAFLFVAAYRELPTAMLPLFAAGIASGSVVLGWLLLRGRRSVPLVAACHATFTLFIATAGARGALAAVEALVLGVLAITIAIHELREDVAARRMLPPVAI
jgi:membrane protease YdiL (CAAX protease family)